MNLNAPKKIKVLEIDFDTGPQDYIIIQDPADIILKQVIKGDPGTLPGL